MIRSDSMWLFSMWPPENRVSQTWFPTWRPRGNLVVMWLNHVEDLEIDSISNRGFFKINVSHCNSLLSLTLFLTQTSLTLSLSRRTFKRLSHWPSSLTQSPLSVSTISHSSLSPKVSTFITESHSEVYKALIKSPLSLLELWVPSVYAVSLKKKVSRFKVCFTVWLPRNHGKNQRNFGFNSFFSILVSVLNF